MRSSALKILIPILLGPILLAVPAIAQNLDYDFHWSPSPAVDNSGNARPEAVEYEVYLKRGGSAEVLVATVADTVFTLSAEPGVAQRLMVRGVSADGRYSTMSEPSDPIYFEITEEDTRGVPGVPLSAELRGNYPNPFNPETRVVYGVPDSATGNELMRLEIYNLQGQLVRRLEVDPSPGWHEATWDGKDDSGVVAATGMYLTRFAVGTMVTSGKMTMVK